jgi:hypothetical protein
MVPNPELDNILVAKDLIVTLAALVGMSLGLYNFWKERSKEKVKLRVIPKSVLKRVINNLGQEYLKTSENEFIQSNAQDLFAIEVVNLSRFTVVVNEVGFLISGKKQRMSISVPVLGDQGEWPRKLEPRDAVTIYGKLQEILLSPDIKNVSCAFAKTACNHIEKGRTEALKQLVQSVKNE